MAAPSFYESQNRYNVLGISDAFSKFVIKNSTYKAMKFKFFEELQVKIRNVWCSAEKQRVPRRLRKIFPNFEKEH